MEDLRKLGNLFNEEYAADLNKVGGEFIASICFNSLHISMDCLFMFLWIASQYIFQWIEF